MPQQENENAVVKLNKQQIKALKNLSKKKSVNLCMKDKAAHPLPVLIGGLAVIAVVTFLVAKFAVVDQLDRVFQVESEYEERNAYNESLLNKAERYDEVKEEYHKYSMDWIDDSENGVYVGVERTKVLDIIEEKLMSKGAVNSISINDNVVVVNMAGMNLKQISEMFISLQEHELVKDASLNIASTGEDSTDESLLEFSVTINLSEEEVSDDVK